MNGEMKTWIGKKLKVEILFSSAGVAQQIRVANDRGAFLLDAGDGTLRDLLAHGLDPGEIGGLVFTHGHFDHMGGLHSLLGFMRMIGRSEPLPIFAPEGCIEVLSTVGNFNKCYAGTLPFEILISEVQSHESFELAGMTINAYPVVHCGGLIGGDILDRIPALGYRISYRAESIAVSGDTGDCPALRELVDGADFAVLEATYRTSADASEQALKNVHLSEDLAQEIGSSAKEYTLIHKTNRFS
jgi:ribonuclease Z